MVTAEYPSAVLSNTGTLSVPDIVAIELSASENGALGFRGGSVFFMASVCTANKHVENYYYWQNSN